MPVQSKPDITHLTGKDGTTLGEYKVTPDYVEFTPSPELKFLKATPPFESFLLDRVFGAAKYLEADDPAITEKFDFGIGYSPDDVIVSIRVLNYKNERKLREVQSSIRWTFEKMLDKQKRG